MELLMVLAVKILALYEVGVKYGTSESSLTKSVVGTLTDSSDYCKSEWTDRK